MPTSLPVRGQHLQIGKKGSIYQYDKSFWYILPFIAVHNFRERNDLIQKKKLRIDLASERKKKSPFNALSILSGLAIYMNLNNLLNA